MASRHLRQGFRPALRPTFAAALLLLSMAASLPIAAAAPTNGTGFEGSYDNGAVPADTAGAVSDTHVLTTLNGGVRIHTRAGTLVSSQSLDAFWGKTGTFDPRTTYDPYGGRFITTVLYGPAATREFGIAVSTSGSPTGSASFFKQTYRFDSTGACTPDYSTVGFNKDMIVVSYKVEDVGGCAWSGGVQLIIFDKAQLYASQGVGYSSWTIGSAAMCGGPCDRPIMPATTFSSTLDRVYLINEYNRDAGQLQIRSLSGSASAPVLSAATTVTAPGGATWASPPYAAQPGTGVLLDTRGTKIDSLIYRNGHLWASQTVGLSTGGVTRAAVQWWEIDPLAASTPKQFGRVDDTSGRHRFFGSLAVNSNNDVLIGYTLSSATMNPSAAYAWRQGNTAKNAMGGIDQVFQAGQGAYTEANGRWGDYSATVVDPTNHRHMWTLQLHATANVNDWRAYWQQVQFSTAAFDATFTGVRGNEWWIQAQVGTNSAALQAVHFRVNGGAWQAMTEQSWGWAASPHILQGSVVQLRATAADGSTELSACYQWIPPSGADATVVSCSYAFDATFTNPSGNEWWVEVTVTANKALAGVDARVNCGTWRALTKASWGDWAASFNIPSGSKVDFRARATTGETDVSGGYIWPSATPTSGC